MTFRRTRTICISTNSEKEMKRVIFVAVPALALLVAACGDKPEVVKQKAFDACLAWAKAQEKYASAEIGAMDNATITINTDKSVTVSIPAKIGEDEGKVECSVAKKGKEMAVTSGN
jgi:hypothetical protein